MLSVGEVYYNIDMGERISIDTGEGPFLGLTDEISSALDTGLALSLDQAEEVIHTFEAMEMLARPVAPEALDMLRALVAARDDDDELLQ